MNAALLLLPGTLIALGGVITVAAFRPRHARLADALSVIADTQNAPHVEPARGVSRLGAWWIDTRRVVASPTLEGRLRLRGTTLTEHYTHKVLGALIGFLLPVVGGLVLWMLAGAAPVIPVLVGVALALVGFLLPDLLLRRGVAGTAEDATEALLTYFDLVTLERLANQSGTQSLHAAAAMSDIPVFAAIRATLDRARMQQRAPYADLKQLGRELDLTALGDLADVMRLDESGASLAVALRARVRELRDAHLTQMRMAAADVSERMTVWMVIPSLAFGLFFLVPPLLTLVGGG